MSNPARVLYRNPLYDSQLVRTLAATTAHAADLGETLATARRVDKLTGDAWYRAWSQTGDTAHLLGLKLRDVGDRVGARHAFLRASEYYRQAYYFVRSDLDDPRLQGGYRRHVDAFLAALDLMDERVEPIRIPYEDTTLKGYLFRPAGSPAYRPTIIFPAGYDSTAEAGWSNVPPALARGYNALLFEGPGQGESLFSQRLYLRPDFEHVLAPVLDCLLVRAEVDPTRIVLVGRSFAGYLAPRAAAVEHRIAALVCDPAQPDIGAQVPRGLTGKIAIPFVSAHSRFSAGQAEFLGARMAAHGARTIGDYFAELRRFTMLDLAAAIACPTLIVEAENDFAGGRGTDFRAALTCRSDIVHLTAESGTDGHCAGLGQELWNNTVYGWLSRVLKVDVPRVSGRNYRAVVR